MNIKKFSAIAGLALSFFAISNGKVNAQSVLCPDDVSINTAIGCIPVATPTLLASFLLTRGIGIGGGVALLMAGYAGIQIMMSGGDPQKLQSGKNLLTAAITGLLFLVFGAFLLQLIGVEILNIPFLATP